ncbi:MAG: hypothetical protein AAF647_02140 [Pseudomonadota bacterium]
MLPMAIADSTRTLAAEKRAYGRLMVHDAICPATGAPMMVSLWEPTPAELRELMTGGAVRLIIYGTAHPPVSLSTKAPPPVRGG